MHGSILNHFRIRDGQQDAQKQQVYLPDRKSSEVGYNVDSCLCQRWKQKIFTVVMI